LQPLATLKTPVFYSDYLLARENIIARMTEASVEHNAPPRLQVDFLFGFVN
jgi:hypothetical protein